MWMAMELFSRWRWTSISAYRSNKYGMLPSMSFIIFCFCHKHNSLPLGLIQPSSPSTKELQCIDSNAIDSSSRRWTTSKSILIGLRRKGWEIISMDRSLRSEQRFCVSNKREPFRDVATFSVNQCDQIGRFIGLWATYHSLWQQLICPNLPHS